MSGASTFKGALCVAATLIGLWLMMTVCGPVCSEVLWGRTVGAVLRALSPQTPKQGPPDGAAPPYPRPPPPAATPPALVPPALGPQVSEAVTGASQPPAAAAASDAPHAGPARGGAGPSPPPSPAPTPTPAAPSPPVAPATGPASALQATRSYSPPPTPGARAAAHPGPLPEATRPRKGSKPPLMDLEQWEALDRALEGRPKDRPIIVAMSNGAFVDLTLNFLCSLSRLGLHDYLLFTDEDAHAEFAKFNISTVVISARSDVGVFSGRRFASLTRKKVQTVAQVIRKGHEVCVGEGAPGVTAVPPHPHFRLCPCFGGGGKGGPEETCHQRLPVQT